MFFDLLLLPFKLPIRLAEHMLATALFPEDDLHFLLCDHCAKGRPQELHVHLSVDEDR